MSEITKQIDQQFETTMNYAKSMLEIINELIEINSVAVTDTRDVRSLKETNLARIKQGLREIVPESVR